MCVLFIHNKHVSYKVLYICEGRISRTLFGAARKFIL